MTQYVGRDIPSRHTPTVQAIPRGKKTTMLRSLAQMVLAAPAILAAVWLLFIIYEHSINLQ
ncbi:MAG TPA: hypothetical protein VGL07_16825 [Buttiauxella sp.]|jgi:hypothetical protein